MNKTKQSKSFSFKYVQTENKFSINSISFYLQQQQQRRQQHRQQKNSK